MEEPPCPRVMYLLMVPWNACVISPNGTRGHGRCYTAHSYPHVLRAARRRINHRLRSTYDADDFVSDVMLDSLRDIDRLEFPSLDALIVHLQLQTERKVRDALRSCRDSS